MPTFRRFLFIGCCLFIASFSFGAGFLGDLGYVVMVSPDPNRAFSQMEMTNAIMLGIGAVVLTAGYGCIIARAILQRRLLTLTMVLAFVGYVGSSLLLYGLAAYLLAPCL